jgi:hypothetical protein
MMIQPNLLKSEVLSVQSRIFLCGPGYTSENISVRNQAQDALQKFPKVEAIYGEDIENKFSFRKLGTDLQTLEAQFAHEVDFTLLILESPGSIAELGTFSQIPAIRDRLVVLLPDRFYRAESYISRGPLSLLTRNNPNSVIYYNANNFDDLINRVRYPLTFYKYAHYLGGYQYQYSIRTSSSPKNGNYSEYIKPLRMSYEMAITLISIILGERPSYADLLLFSGLAPKQLNRALHKLFDEKKIEKIESGRYRSTNGYNDDLLQPFNSTEISKLRSASLAS